MTRPGLFIIGAVLLAAAILAIAWLGGEPAPVNVDDDLAAPQLQPPGELFDGPGNPDASPLQHMERGQFRSVEGDRVQIFSFRSFDPRSKFVSDFTEPRAELYFGDGRVLLIEADAGTFFHPGNDPQRGSFDENVVVTLYENVQEGELDTATDDRVAVRLFLDAQTDFDRDIGRLVSLGPVLLTGPDAEFTGRNLDLTYNPADRRIETLTIEHGELLRIRRPDEQDPGETQSANADATPDPALNNAPPDPSANTDTESPADEDAANATDDPAPAPQFYRAEFQDDVVVRVGQDEAELLGDTLRAFFAFTEDTEQEITRTSTTDTGDAPPAPIQRNRVSPRLAQADASTPDATLTDAAPALPPPPTRSLFTPSDDDVRITWAGVLRVTPLDTGPPDLQDPDDAILALIGSPARLTAQSDTLSADPRDADAQAKAVADRAVGITSTSTVDEPTPTTVTADELRYFTSSKRVEAQGSPHRPFVLEDPAQGKLTGVRLAMTPALNIANVQGPGRLTASPALAETPTDEPPLDIAFAQRLRLDFEPIPDPDDDTRQRTALRRATFQGDVHAVAPGDGPDDRLDLTAQAVIVDLATDARGKTTPTTLTARREVLAQQAEQSIQADELVAALMQTDRESDKPDADQSDLADGITLDTLTATGNVTVLASDVTPIDTATDTGSAAGLTTLTGHQLVARPEAGRLTLLGNDTRRARLQSPDADLAADRLEFDDTTQTLHAPGAGELTSRGDDGTTLTVTWQTQLDYDGLAGTAAALGGVLATTESPTESTRLQAHRLDLAFVPTPRDDNKTERAAQADPSDHGRADLKPELDFELRTVHATPDPDQPDAPIEFRAWTPLPTPDPANPDQPATRLTLIGPDLFLENHPTDLDAQRIAVTGPGQMLLEDYRQPDQEPDQNPEENPDADGNPLQLSGQGVTFFQWADALRVNLHTNDLTMHGQVSMLHDPADDEPTVKLFSDLLTADLTETQPLAALINNPQNKDEKTPAVDPELRRVQLDGRVRVTQTTRRIFADQLVYEAADRNVHLEALPGMAVRVYDTDDENAQLEAEAIRWNLDRDRIHVTKPRGGVMPLE